MSDQELLTNFITRSDEAAFTALVLRYGPMVLRVCRDVLDRQVDAEDAFQATFLVMFRQAGSIRDRASIGRWLCEVAWRISRRERRRSVRLRSQERRAVEMEAGARPEEDPEVREIKPILHDEIRLLPAKLRDPILLCYFEGLTVEEAAGRLRIPLGTIKSRLARGRERLRSRLTRRGLAASTLLLLMFGLTDEVPAAVPSRLVRSTVESGLRVSSGVNPRIAGMVRAEELRQARSSPGGYRGLLIVLILALTIAGLASGRISETAHEVAAEMFALEAPRHCGAAED
ncbi:RNA polymerase sigma factor [Tundrisphaera lichenicola]|uniref:RNA polymerase sigma factor n=1 Tax=Tundrisphaera lichenicola TaxID=2029860 RepID=UPI003EB6F22C